MANEPVSACLHLPSFIEEMFHLYYYTIEDLTRRRQPSPKAPAGAAFYMKHCAPPFIKVISLDN